mgnify:CR=1 FL=1
MPDIFDYVEQGSKMDSAKSGQAAEFRRLGVKPPAEANIDIFDQVAGEKKAPAKTETPKKDEQGFLSKAYDFVGRGPGLASTGAGIIGTMLAPETGGLSLLVPALMAGGGGAAVDYLSGGKDPLTTGATSAIGQLGGGVLQKAGGWATGKIASKFELGKYIGNVGEKLSEVLHLPPMKTAQDIYSAFNLGTAEKAISDAYAGAQQKIFSVVSPDTAIKGPPAKFLNKIYYDNVPEYRSLIDAVVANSSKKGGFVSKYSGFKKMPKQEEQNLLNNALDTVPITVENAMEYAKLLGAYSSSAKQGARGFATREANRDARETISKVLDDLKPGAGQVYRGMNMDFRRGMTTLSAFGEKELFKTGPGGPTLNRVEWQKASNDALKKLQEVGLEDLDSVIRLGRQPGATGSMFGMSGRIPGVKWLNPGKWIDMENPLRPDSAIPNELIRKLLKSTPGAVGSNVGAQFGEE